MARHVFHFTGTHASSVNVAQGPFLRTLLNVLVEGCQRATRLRVDGRSTVPGTPPAWLETAASFDVADIGHDSVLLTSYPLSQLTRRFDQREMFSSIDPSRSCLDLLEDSLEDALLGRENSDRYDHQLMETLEEFERLFRFGVDKIEVINGRSLLVDHSSLESIKRLRSSTPGDQPVQFTGKLETIRHSDRAFVLVLDSGIKLWGIAGSNAIKPTDLAELFGKRALVEGTAKFRPSGTILRIEADRIVDASTTTAKLTGVREELRRLVEEGRVDEARSLVNRESHGDGWAELKALSNLLALPSASSQEISGRGDFDRNAGWLREHGKAHRGEWVALRDGSLVDHDRNFLSLRQRLIATGVERTVFCTKVED